MSLNKTTAELQKELDDLIAEQKRLVKERAEHEAAVIAINKRLSQFRPWRGMGLIEKKELELENSRYPIFEEAGFSVKRIVNVCSKWIFIKEDRDEIKDAVKYKIENGWRERARSADYGIDVKKALEIWEAHKAGL